MYLCNTPLYVSTKHLPTYLLTYLPTYLCVQVLVLSKGEVFIPPTLTALQMPARRYPLGDQGTVTTTFTEEGIFKLCIGTYSLLLLLCHA